MANRLRECGITPVDLITDIANYVELEFRQKLLILDQRCCSGCLTLRQPFPGESDADSSVITGDFEPIVIGNTICCEDAIPGSDTQSIIICAMHTNQNTNDQLLTYTAVQRMCQLIEQLHCGTVSDGTIDILNYVPHEHCIICSLEDINRTINADFTEDTLSELLRPTEITMDAGQFRIPAHRSDLISADDLINEIVRIQKARKINICS